MSARRQAVDELEPQGAYGFERPSVGIFQGAIAFCQPGFDMEVGQEVVYAEKMTTVGQVGGDRIVTGDFAMMRIISTAGAADLLSRA